MDDCQIDLSVVRLFDERCTKILDKSPGVHLYVFDKAKLEWVKTAIGGVLFVCQRSTEPHYALHVINRSDSKNNSLQPITPSLEILLRPPHMFYRTSSAIFSMWFCVANDCKRIYELLKRLISSADYKEKTVKDAFLSPPIKPSVNDGVKMVSSGSNIPTECSSIRQLLSSASEEFERSVNDAESKSVLSLSDPSNALKYHLSYIAMDAPPFSNNSSECQFASDLERTLKEGSTPKLEEAVASIPIFSKEEEDKVTDELLRRLREDTKTSVQDTKTNPNLGDGLTRDQLKAALLYIIENDEDFLTSIHMAYSECLNKRLQGAS